MRRSSWSVRRRGAWLRSLWTASRVSEVIGTSNTRNSESVPSCRGLEVKPAFARLRSSKESTLIRSDPPGVTSPRFALRAAGFMATSTWGASPGVRMSWSEMWIWKAETPARVPAGARISAGKSGRVARSLPKTALVSVNRVPVTCMPSPESPAKRITTRSIWLDSPGRSATSVTDGHLRPGPLRRARFTLRRPPPARRAWLPLR